MINDVAAKAIVHQSLLRPATVLGCDSNAMGLLVLLSGLLTLLCFRGGVVFLFLGVGLFFVGFSFLRAWGADDPFAWRVYRRTTRYQQSFYAAQSDPSAAARVWERWC